MIYVKDSRSNHQFIENTGRGQKNGLNDINQMQNPDNSAGHDPIFTNK